MNKMACLMFFVIFIYLVHGKTRLMYIARLV